MLLQTCLRKSEAEGGRVRRVFHRATEGNNGSVIRRLGPLVGRICFDDHRAIHLPSQCLLSLFALCSFFFQCFYSVVSGLVVDVSD